MPKYKITREDILRTEEVDKIIKMCNHNLINGRKILQINPLFQIKIIPERLMCLIALLWLFGKRIRETLKLRVKDITITPTHLEVRFFVLKKRVKSGIASRSTKKISRRNPYTNYIVDYLERKLYLPGNKGKLKDENCWLFPGKKGKRSQKVTQKWFSKREGEWKEKTYTYERGDKGRMSVETAWAIMQALSKDIWNHLFRGSLATRMAEHEATEDELMKWFDWDDAKTAHGYVRKHSPRLGKRFEEREW